MCTELQAIFCVFMCVCGFFGGLRNADAEGSPCRRRIGVVVALQHERPAISRSRSLICTHHSRRFFGCKSTQTKKNADFNIDQNAALREHGKKMDVPHAYRSGTQPLAHTDGRAPLWRDALDDRAERDVGGGGG